MSGYLAVLELTAKADKCVVHFMHPDFRTCEIMAGHLKNLAKQHFKTRFYYFRGVIYHHRSRPTSPTSTPHHSNPLHPIAVPANPLFAVSSSYPKKACDAMLTRCVCSIDCSR